MQGMEAFLAILATSPPLPCSLVPVFLLQPLQARLHLQTSVHSSPLPLPHNLSCNLLGFVCTITCSPWCSSPASGKMHTHTQGETPWERSVVSTWHMPYLQCFNKCYMLNKVVRQIQSQINIPRHTVHSASKLVCFIKFLASFTLYMYYMCAINWGIVSIKTFL